MVQSLLQPLPRAAPQEENDNVNTPIGKPTVSPIAPLTEAAEFLMCAVRAMAHGKEVNSPEVHLQLAWAASKIADASGATVRFARGVPKPVA
jgi:hypothetical protein